MDVLPAPVADALQTWSAVHDEFAPGAVEALYVVGSVALGDWTSHSDIDVVAVVADPSEPELAEALRASHAAFRGRSDAFVDGPFVGWGDLVVPPMAVQRPWVLDGEFHLDGESFEINPVTWYTLARYGITLRGTQPDGIGLHVDEVERKLWVRENLDTYWRGVGDRLAAAIGADERTDGFDGAVLEWTVLGVARMLYTYETGDVTSKTGAGEWAAQRGPDFRPLLDAAIEQRRSPGTVTKSLLEEAGEFVEQVLAIVTR